MRDGLPAGYDRWRLASPDAEDELDESYAEDCYDEYAAECGDEGIEPVDYSSWIDANYHRQIDEAKQAAAEARAEAILDDREYWAGRDY